MASIAEANSLFEIDMELDSLLEEIELQIEAEEEPSEELVARFQEFCEARGRESRSDRPIPPHDGNPRTILPERGCASGRSRTRRGNQDRTHEEYGALLPVEPGPEED